MNVNKQKSQIINFFSPPYRLRRVNKNIDEVQKVYKERMVQLLQFFLPVKMLRVESPYLLALERSNDGIIVCEVVSKKGNSIKISI
jgi:hypothetical protein